LSATAQKTTYKKIEPTVKQLEALKIISKNRVTNLAGGSRSGKTFIALYAMIWRALKYPRTRQLVARFRFSHAKQAICYDTMPKILEILGMRDKVRLNKTDWFYEFPNGSTIWIGGLDDKERLEKILGNEYSTVFLNEASQISYDAYEMIITRLNPPRGIKGKIIIDYNPPSIQHWGYKMFIKKQFPDGRPLPGDDYASILMNPQDNIDNISEDYIKTLESLSVNKRKRFLEGQYSVDSGSLWKRGWIRYDDNIPSLWRVVVGVDPAGTVDGDEVGIIVAGQFEDKYYILDDYSCHGTPNEWAAEVAAAYNKWSADVVVAEKNYGGDMVESTIKNAQPTINVKLVNASRGKIVRAEPISALYEQGKIFHRIPFIELEDELCIFEPGMDQSPNRLDAMVWSITELSGEGYSMLDVL
jgi:phage terminase large subunit-like protein